MEQSNAEEAAPFGASIHGSMMINLEERAAKMADFIGDESGFPSEKIKQNCREWLKFELREVEREAMAAGRIAGLEEAAAVAENAHGMYIVNNGWLDITKEQADGVAQEIRNSIMDIRARIEAVKKESE